MKRKILGIVLVLVMVVSLMPSVGITYAAPDANATYTVDTSAAHTQAVSDYHYEQSGATLTADGYNLTAASGDFDARVWVTGCSLGNQVADGGLTVSFTATLPESNAGAVYYVYSAEQNNAESYPFVGFMPVSGGYRLLSNMVHGNDTFYNDVIYTGSVPVILYITPEQFELYVNGAYIATVDAESSLSLGDRWFYGFKSFWAGETQTTLTVTDLKYLNGKAILQDGSAVATEAPATQAPVTEAPVTEEPTLTEEPEEGFSLTPYPNNGATNNGDGTFTLDTSGGDAQLYWWADPINAAMGEGKGVQISMTADIPAGNADRGCFSLGFMRGTGSDHNWRGGFTGGLDAGSNHIVLTIQADGSFVSTVNGTENMTGNMLTELAGQPLWNVCFHSSMAAGHMNSATISGFSATTFEGENVPSAPTQAPATDAPDGTTQVPTAAPIGLSPYPNNGCTDNHDGTYDLSTSGGDAQLYWWADALSGALEEGMSVRISLVVDVAAGNADGGCFSFGYMRGTGNDHNWKGEFTNGLNSGRNEVVVTISPDGSFVTTVNDIQDMTGNMLTELAGQPLWNVCVHSSMAAGHMNSATVSEFSAVKYFGDAPVEQPTEQPTQAPSTESPSEAPTQAPNLVQATITASLSANGGAIDGLTGSTTVVVVSDATVTSGEDLNAVFAIIVYDGAGKIVNIAYEEIEINAEVSHSVTKALEAGFNLPSNIEGYKIRIAVYDSLASLNQIAGVSYTIE